MTRKKPIKTYRKRVIGSVGAALLAAPLLLANTSPSIYDRFVTLFTDDELTMVFVGDMMFDRYIRKKAEQFSYDWPLGGVYTLTKNADITVGNLEGPITSYPSKSLDSEIGSPDNFVFTFAPAVAGALADAGFDAVSIANNHSTNFGREGVEQTYAYLEKEGVAVFGNPYSTVQNAIVLEKKGYTVGLVGYNEFSSGAVQTTLQSINTLIARNTDIIVVMAHWGQEYQQVPLQKDRDIAHQFLTAGADFVVGAHPHVVQSKEVYEGKYIYYSLGNFVFDQYWNKHVSCGMALRVTLQGGVWNFEEIPVYSKGDATTLVGGCAYELEQL